MIRRHLIVMVKEPRPGHVKTRLGRDIGMVAAAWWFRRQSLSLLRRVRDPRWRLSLAVSPDREGMQSRIWPGDLHRIPQGTGDLGTRMARLLRHPGPTIVIGADIPGVTRNHIADAFRILGRADAVTGPATDGGYWLIGLRGGALPPRLFENVRWSTEHAHADTVDTASHLRWGTAATLSDVDTAADLDKSR